MPKTLTREVFKCVYCGKEFNTEEAAKRHEQVEHDIIYVALERSEYNKLLQFMYANVDSATKMLTEDTWRKLTKIARAK